MSDDYTPVYPAGFVKKPPPATEHFWCPEPRASF